MQDQFEQRMRMSLLLREIDECRTIGEIFDLVKREHIAVSAAIRQGGSEDPSGFVPESLRKQVREAAVATLCGGKVYRPAPPNDERDELIREVDECETIDKLFEIVRDRHIVIQMKSQNAASNIPFEPLPENPELSPLETLRSQVREAADAMFRSDDKQDLIREVQTCPTIDKLFEIVRDRNIVIQMKSQNSASCLPQKQFSEEELMPDTTPLERLRQQVLEAILYG